jgi:RHS repeat-associated protein
VRSDGTTIKYYAFAGMSVAMNSGSGLNYLLTDHLGSVIAVLGNESSGIPISQQRYYPFGGVRQDVGTIGQTDFSFTGQRSLDAQGIGFSIGLVDYKFRMYDPYLNRWTQPDSIIPDGNPQSLNRYSYAANNPIRYNDPSGHCVGAGGHDFPDGSPACNIGSKTSIPISISNNNVDSGYDITPIGGVPATQPYRKSSYGDIEDSCGGCSAEGVGNAPGADELGIINDILAAGLDAKSIYDKDDITVYVAYLRKLGIQVNSLYINNRTNRPVSVMSVDFTTREFAPTRFCFSSDCMFSAPDAPYKVTSGAGIYAKGDYGGVGPVSYPGGEPIGLTTRIPLVPSGNPNNSNNSFYWYTEVTINVQLAYTDTGTYWPTISFTFDHR